MKGEFTVKITIPERQVKNMVSSSVLYQLKSETNKTAIMVIEDKLVKGIDKIDIKELIKSGVVSYLEKYKLKEIATECIRNILEDKSIKEIKELFQDEKEKKKDGERGLDL